MADRTPLTVLLERARIGDAGASDALYASVYDELKRIAHRQLRRQPAGHTLVSTALVHEAWMRLAPREAGSYHDSAHYLNAAASAMRSVLVDYARRRNAAKRGSGVPPTALDEVLDGYEERSLDVVAVNDALGNLEVHDGQLARIVELRVFGGLTIAETAHAIDSSSSTVERGWRTAKAWMKLELGAET